MWVCTVSATFTPDLRPDSYELAFEAQDTPTAVSSEFIIEKDHPAGGAMFGKEFLEWIVTMPVDDKVFRMAKDPLHHSHHFCRGFTNGLLVKLFDTLPTLQRRMCKGPRAGGPCGPYRGDVPHLGTGRPGRNGPDLNPTPAYYLRLRRLSLLGP